MSIRCVWGCETCPRTLTQGQGGFGSSGQRDRGDGFGGGGGGGCSFVTQQLVCGTLLMTGQVICAGGAVWASDVRRQREIKEPKHDRYGMIGSYAAVIGEAKKY